MSRAELPLSIGPSLEMAARHAGAGQFAAMRGICARLLDQCADPAVLIDIAVLLANSGFLSDADDCLRRVLVLVPGDIRALVNSANLAREEGAHERARGIYADLVKAAPSHPVIRRNWLTCLEYDPAATDAERMQTAMAWGEWATCRAGGPRPRPPFRSGPGTLRIGYVSPDFCQHTVGLLVKDVIRSHDPQRMRVFAYSAGRVNDWVTDEVRRASTFRDVSAADDADLARQVEADAIDVLVDLAGHTAGSRLTAFALRPAPVMVSWLGYFATTGLPCIDAVVLDEWHAPAAADSQFVEQVLRLPTGRFPYTPVPWAPSEVASAPSLRKGHITFGSFNNTAKLNAAVLDAWSEILQAVPDSRLLLKWRTFNDERFRLRLAQAFEQRGIAAARVELRGPSSHADMLKEYADIDIALDTFPFTGGLTTCEALWAGVPVVTWPQSRVVSRQSLAILSSIGLEDLAARGREGYVRKAVELASDGPNLSALRASMRARMTASKLMDVAGFTRALETALGELVLKVKASG